jgi:hypothetical protein
MTIAVCIPDVTCVLTEEYPAVVVRLWPDTARFLDDPGYVDVDVAIVDCRCCCEAFTLTGNDTVNAGNTWTGTIDPACPGATATVVANSSNCTFTGVVNGAGSQVTVDVGAGDCGGFTVTVTEGSSDCSGESASFGVRILGNGGAWANKCTRPGTQCNNQGLITTVSELCRWRIECGDSTGNCYECGQEGDYQCHNGWGDCSGAFPGCTSCPVDNGKFYYQLANVDHWECGTC